jgi:hypothetical protein
MKTTTSRIRLEGPRATGICQLILVGLAGSLDEAPQNPAQLNRGLWRRSARPSTAHLRVNEARAFPEAWWRRFSILRSPRACTDCTARRVG